MTLAAVLLGLVCFAFASLKLFDSGHAPHEERGTRRIEAIMAALCGILILTLAIDMYNTMVDNRANLGIGHDATSRTSSTVTYLSIVAVVFIIGYTIVQLTRGNRTAAIATSIAALVGISAVSQSLLMYAYSSSLNQLALVQSGALIMADVMPVILIGFIFYDRGYSNGQLDINYTLPPDVQTKAYDYRLKEEDLRTP